MSSDAVPFSLLISNSPPTLFLNLLPLAITTLKKKPPITIMLILKKLHHKQHQRKNKIRHHRGRWRHCCRHLFCGKATKERQIRHFLAAKPRRWRQLSSSSSIQSCNLLCYVIRGKKKQNKRRRRWRQLPSPSSWSCVTVQLHKQCSSNCRHLLHEIAL